VFSNVGYYLLSLAGGPNLLLMYSATSFELLTSGMGTGAFSVLLLRMTQKRFSATQYALFSSLFALPRLLAGPVTGFAVDAIGWPTFFLTTMAIGIPGMLMLARFVPPGVREPEFTVERQARRVPVAPAGLVTRGAVGGLLIGAAGFALVALLSALKTARDVPGAGFDFGAALLQAGQPAGVAEWIQLVGILVFALVGGLFVAAVAAARSGAAGVVADEDAA
jgi:PAT family beta-lactamase induction signal transducer AmpG